MVDYISDEELREALGTPEPEINGSVPVVREEYPVLDWDNYGYGDSQRLAILRMEMAKVVGSTDEQRARELVDEYERLIRALIISVPRSWLTRTAPAALDWSKSETSLYYVRKDRLQDLIQFIMLEQHEVADKAKN